MKNKAVLVRCEKGAFPLHIKDTCKRCGKPIDTSKGDLYNIFANVLTAEEYPNDARVSYNVFCNDCTLEIGKFIGAKGIYHKGKLVQKIDLQNSKG